MSGGWVTRGRTETFEEHLLVRRLNGTKAMQMIGSTVAHLHTRGGVIPAAEVAFTTFYGTLASVMKQATA